MINNTPDLKQIDLKMIKSFIYQCIEDRYSYYTVLGFKKMVQSLLSFAEEEGFVDKLVKVRMPAQLRPEHVVKEVSKSDFIRVDKYLNDLVERYPEKIIFKYFFNIIKNTGARLGGVVSIQRKHVDLELRKLSLFEKGRGGKKKER